MAYLKLWRVGSSAFHFATSCARVHFAVGGVLTDGVSCGVGFAAGRAISRGFSVDSEGAPVPAWQYWKAIAEIAQAKVEIEKAKAEHWSWRCKASAKEYLTSIGHARLEILQYKYQLKARGILELFIRALTSEAYLHCHRKGEDEHLPEEERKFYKDFAVNWFPQARKEIWRVILEMPTMIDFKEDMQKVLSLQDLDLLVMKATAFHKELHHFHHSGVRQRETVTFVREHIRQSIRDHSVDPVHLEGFMQAMAKKINVNVLFVDEREVSEGADE